MKDKNSNELNYEDLLKLIDKVKMCSGCNEVELVGNHKTFQELIVKGFSLDKFKCTEATSPFELDRSQLYIIPIE